jgi:DNA-binding MarR family transcriptional regulator/GNAT superfamily N-acetyltransferase
MATKFPALATGPLAARADVVRRFNRFYTRQIGVLDEHLLGSDFSLTEARVLYELAHRESLTSSDLCRELGLNAGYVSRVISGFARKGLVGKARSASDARAAELRLTAKGRAAFEPLNDGSRREILSLLERLSGPEQQQLVEAMGQIEGLLGDEAPAYLLRDPRPGDMGWIVHRQAMLYAQEYGWNSEYEALVAEIVAKFLREFVPAHERCWIAEKNGSAVGSVFVVRADEITAKLRLLYVEPSTRGLGIGSRLVEECLHFARLVGYKRMILWTNSVLADARRIYERAGFKLIEEKAHHSFGKDLVGQTWAIEL